MRYYRSLYLKGFQSYRPSKFAVKKQADILGSRLRFSRDLCTYILNNLIARFDLIKNTAMKIRLHTIADIWSKVGVL